MVAEWSSLVIGSSSRLFNINCCWSASTSNVDIDDLSSGMTCFLFHVPHAYSKKLTQGSASVFIAESSEDAVLTHSSVRHMLLAEGMRKMLWQTEEYNINRIKLHMHSSWWWMTEGRKRKFQVLVVTHNLIYNSISGADLIRKLHQRVTRLGYRISNALVNASLDLFNLIDAFIYDELRRRFNWNRSGNKTTTYTIAFA